MNSKNMRAEKLIYRSPHIARVELDNEISLVLESTVKPDGEPIFTKAPEYLNNDPFKTNLG